jgi:hypothetical protein
LSGNFYPDAALDRTVAPYTRTVGHEVEYSSGAEVAALLQDEGNGTPARSTGYRLHSYGCDCNARDNYPIHTTSDSTAAGGEYLIGGSRGVLFGSDAYIKATKILSDAAIQIGCGTSTAVGMHTHVGIQDPDGRNRLTTAQLINVCRIYVRYLNEIRALAAGHMDAPRNNGCTPGNFDLNQYLSYRAGIDSNAFWNTDENQLSIQLPNDGHIRFSTEHTTIEFRVWNSTKAQWRMVLAGAVSSAIVEAGKENRRAHPDNPATLTEFMKGLFTPDILLLIERQMKKAYV